MPPSPKRKAADAPVSPPPLKRKIQSGTTKSAVASFFTPASQKPKAKTTWAERAPEEDAPATLIVGRYDGEERGAKRRRVAAFDLDSTLITTASGKKFAQGAADWKWWDPAVPQRVRELYDDGYQVVIFSNQGALSLHDDPKSKAPKAGAKEKVAAFKQKCSAILSQLDIPASVYGATEKDTYRKPRKGMWLEFCADYGLGRDVDVDGSFFVGDAGGRIAVPKGDGGKKAVSKDFSCSDRNFAHNVGIEFKTPEEFFLGEQPREFQRDFDVETYAFGADDDVVFEKRNRQEIVLFCGPPGAGKSTFFWTYLKPLGYERINQDTLKTRPKCISAAADCLAAGDSVVVDNTNADPATRADWIALAKKCEVPIRCAWFKTPVHVAQHNDAVRSQVKAMNPESRASLPGMAFSGFSARFKEPTTSEGFQDVVEVEFKFRGTKEDYAAWAQYWI